MTASWKIFAFAGGVALAGAVGAACTVTTNSGDDAGDLFNDDAGDNGDTGSADTSAPPACANEILPDGGTSALNFDPPGSGTTACTDCTVANCCAKLPPCFQDSTGQCQALESCIQNQCAGTPDAGTCIQDCTDLYSAGVDAHNTWNDCQTNACASACPVP